MIGFFAACSCEEYGPEGCLVHADFQAAAAHIIASTTYRQDVDDPTVVVSSPDPVEKGTT